MYFATGPMNNFRPMLCLECGCRQLGTSKSRAGLEWSGPNSLSFSMKAFCNRAIPLLFPSKRCSCSCRMGKAASERNYIYLVLLNTTIQQETWGVSFIATHM
ncbi:unnamed protein product [Durusdinium trenchii]|uniref:Uncharacterized protein n=1 Tax=Durusdinium trenchii TaxID=1381693 RepID=A0ABP0J420_9DINO